MPQALIEVDHLSHHVTDEDAALHPLLEDISFSVQPGEWIALLGANGSGKTTLVRHLNALLLPTAGAVRVAGMDTRNVRSRQLIRSTVSMVFQNPDDQIVAGIVEEDTAFGPENLALPAQEIRRRVDTALEQVGLSAQHLRPPHLLSAGQKQRLAIAGALAMQPKCIIFDEATTMLDPGGRRAVLEILRRLHAQGMTIIFITHFMEEAVHAQRILVLSRGRLAADDTPAHIFANSSQLSAWGLELPPVCALAHAFQSSLPEFDSDILTPQQLLQALSALPHASLRLPPAPNPEPPSPPIITVEALAHEYMSGTPLAHKALLDVTCSVPEGSGYALLGATGSGKSTLLQHLNGLLRPQQGRVQVGPFILNDLTINTRAVVQRAGLVFQNPENQLFEQYVGDEIAYGPRQFTLDEPLAARVRWAMELVGLDFEGFKDRLTLTLSGGERRKVALASILALKPSILLLDEPLAGLDPAARRATLARLIELRRQTGITLVLSSHQMEDVALLAQRAVVLAAGRSLAQDSLSSIFNQPALLSSAGLEAPLAAQLAAELRRRGWSLPSNLFTPPDLVQAVLACVQAAAQEAA